MSDLKIVSGNGFSQMGYTLEGTGKPLMLIHGFPENHTLWQRIVPDLSENFTLVLPDVPGSGESKLEDGTITIERLADAMKSILDAENIEQVVIAGHSMGGYIALAFAEKYPSMVKGLSLVHSTATADDEEKKQKRQKSIELIRNGGKEAFIKEMTPNLFAKSFREENKEVIKEQIIRGMQLPEESMIAFYTAMMNRKDRTSILKTATYPVQMIIGKEETIAPMDLLLEQAAMADVSFASVYEDSLHMSMIEKPESLANDLLNFTTYCYT